MTSTESPYTVNKNNYKEGIPSTVTHVFISDDLDQSHYKQIFNSRSSDDDVNGDKKVHVTMHDSINEIQNTAFFLCPKIKSIKIPPNVKRIGTSAFHNSRNLEVVTLPQNLQVIDHGAFGFCESLEEVVLPDTVTRIEENAFYCCISLQSVTLSKSITSISQGALYGCSKLRSIKIPEGVTKIDVAAFAGCSSLQLINLPQTLCTIHIGSFYQCSSLTFFTLPDSLTIIEEDAFSHCIMLQNIVIPKHCTVPFSLKFDNEFDTIIKEHGLEWLKNRFDKLPLHQLCNKHDITINDLANIPPNDPYLKSVDEMNMTPLHVLSCHPNASLDMIRDLAHQYPTAALVKTKKDMFPVELYLSSKNIIRVTIDETSSKLMYDEMDKIRHVMTNTSDCYTIHDIINSGLTYNHDIWDILLAFQGSSMNVQLSKRDKVTGFYPFMTASLRRDKLNLVDAYHLAMANPTLVTKREEERSARICI
jgi:hypothetical protein